MSDRDPCNKSDLLCQTLALCARVPHRIYAMRCQRQLKIHHANRARRRGDFIDSIVLPAKHLLVFRSALYAAHRCDISHQMRGLY